MQTSISTDIPLTFVTANFYNYRRGAEVIMVVLERVVTAASSVLHDVPVERHLHISLAFVFCELKYEGEKYLYHDPFYCVNNRHCIA